MNFEHLKRIFLVKNGFLIYNFVQIVVIISIIYYVRAQYHPILIILDITGLLRKVKYYKNWKTENWLFSFKKPIVILGEFYVTISLIIEVVLRLNNTQNNHSDKDQKQKVHFF